MTEQILNYIQSYTKKNGYEPNESELARELNTTRRTIRAKLAELESEGKIKKIHVPPRGHYVLK